MIRPLFSSGGLLALALLVLPHAATAQSGKRAQRIYAKNLEKKLASPWLTENKWLLDFAEALRVAKKKRKPVLAYFTRSYVACRNCEYFERDVLAKPDFRRKLARDVVLFAHVTSRVTGRANDGLLRKLVKRSERYPTLLFLDGDGKILYQQPEGKRSLGDLVAMRTKVSKLLVVQAKAAKSKAARADLLVARIELGLIDYASAIAERQKLRIGRSKARKLDGLLAKLEFEDLRAQRMPSPALAARLTDMKKAGRIPAGDDRWLFYWYILEQAGRDKDTKVFEECLGIVKELKKHDKGFRNSIAVKEAELARLKRNKRRR